MAKGICAVVITKNEEKNIEACLESVKWADEIIVVDSFSTDKTVEIAKRYTDKVYIKEWIGYGQQKNFAISQATKGWILWLDADERISDGLKKEIISLLNNTEDKPDVYYIPRLTYFLGKYIKRCGWYPGYTPRLFKKGYTQFDNNLIHENLDFKGKAVYLKNDILHFSYNSITDYLEKLNLYTSLQAEELLKKKTEIKQGRWLLTLIWQFFKVFKKMYFNQKGYKDGLHGFLLSFFSAFSRLVTYAKYWELITRAYNKSNYGLR